MKKVLEQGAKWAVEKGYGIKDDLKKIEDNGCLEGNADKVSSRAKARGRDQLGTIGSGNHFVEIQEVQEIFDEKTSKVFGVEKGGITIMIHTGSRGLGHQTASDYIHLMEKEYGFKKLPDRELVCAPINSKLGVDYREAMNASANFAFANRQIITSMIRKSFEKFFPKIKIELVYDVCHNIAKFEEHKIDEKKQMVCVHRKGATRSFGPGRNEIPSIYRKVGQPVIIPGSMGTFSYLLVGTKKAEEISLASTAHGAGRVMSRSSAIRDLNFDKMNKELNSNDILLKAGSKKGAVEESPEAYKDVNEVVRVSDELGIGNIVARMKPLAVIKG
jgi:tRNA-splicing ligase RtcB